jgi:hypothetical protein
VQDHDPALRVGHPGADPAQRMRDRRGRAGDTDRHEQRGEDREEQS